MAGIAEFLQTTVGEALKGVLQPAGTLAGLLFTLLNLAFIYPAALDHRAGWALSFASLDTGWQALVVAVVSLGLGYLILASTDSIATLLAGHATRGSLVSDLLRHWHTRRADRWRTDPTRADVFRRYPASSEIQPTSFGNFIAAGNTIAKDRFGFDLVALWSQLSATAALEKSPALAAARTEKAALDLLGNLTFVLTVFSVEMLAFYAARDESRTALLGLVALAAAALVYRVAVAKARSWADALDSVVDLHREDLRKALGLRKATGLVEERELWTATSEFFNGRERPTSYSIYPLPAPKRLVVEASSNVTAKPVVRAPRETYRQSDDGGYVLRESRHVVVLANADDEATTTAAVMVSDPWIRRVRSTPTSNGAQASVVAGDDFDRLLWQTSLGPLASHVLDYRLPIWTLTTEPADAIRDVRYDRLQGHTVELGQADAVTLKLAGPGADSKPPQVYRLGSPVVPTRGDDGVYWWRLENVGGGETIGVLLPEAT